jgi:hypothetical protein
MERAARARYVSSLAPAVLFFGCRSKATDCLFLEVCCVCFFLEMCCTCVCHMVCCTCIEECTHMAATLGGHAFSQAAGCESV